MPTFVVDADDPRLVDYRALNDAQLRQRYDASAGVCIVEGPLAVRALADSPYTVRSLLVTAQQLAALADVVDRLGAPIYVAAPDQLRRVVGFDLHRGAVASVNRPTPLEPAAALDGARTVVVCEGVNDHENLGALFRNARALGADAVLLDPQTCDPLYRRCIRVSMGHVLRVPFARLPRLPGGFDVLRGAGFTVVALTPAADALDVGLLARPARLALLVGAEGPGLRPETLAAADARTRIPLREGVDSLNVATAAALALQCLAEPYPR